MARPKQQREPKHALGVRINHVMQEKGLVGDYAEVARAMGVTTMAVYGWVDTGRIGKDKLHALANWSGYEVAWWLESYLPDSQGIESVLMASTGGSGDGVTRNQTMQDRLKQLRLERKITKTEVAAALGCSKQYVGQLEDQPAQHPSAGIVYALAKFYGVTMEYLMDGEARHSPVTSPSLIDLLSEASKRSALAFAEASSTETSRFPIVVSQESRVFLERQATAMGGSLAGLCGAILNEVVAETKKRAQTGQN